MARTTLPFGEWRPDVALIDNQLASEAQNVFPGANAYLPILDLAIGGSSSIGTGNDGFTRVMLYFDGADGSTTIVDNNMSGNVRTWTAVGNAQIDTATKKFGPSALLCDGTGDWITTDGSATDIQLNNSDFNIDCFAEPGGVDGTLIYLAGHAGSGLAAINSSWYIARLATNKIQFNISNGSSWTTLTGTSNVIFAAGAFTHIRVNRSGNTITLYINGSQEATGTFSGVSGCTQTLAIGAAGAETTTPWNGWVDGFRIDIGTARSNTVPTADYDMVRGPVFRAKMTTGKDAFFAGTVRKLYKWTWASQAWTDVTRTTGPYNLATGDQWSFAQFGANVYATQVNDVLQSIDATSGSNFAATSGSPPQAGHVATIGDFLVLSGLSSDKKKIQWSAINDPTGWTIGTNLSDSQTMPDGGNVLGVAGDTIGIVVQDDALRSMQFLPGDTDRIFAFSKVESEKGTVGKGAFVYTNGTLFTKDDAGFYAWNGGLQPIGQDAVNNWFSANSHTQRWGEMLAFIIPNSSLVGWAFHNTSSSGTFDYRVFYDWRLNKWSNSTKAAQTWAPVATSTLIRILGGVDTSGNFAYAGGNALTAIVDTAEYEFNPGMRSFVSGVMPLAARHPSFSLTVTVTPYTRETLNGTSTAGTATSLESTTGWASVLVSSRFQKYRTTISASNWATAQGLIVEAMPDGEA